MQKISDLFIQNLKNLPLWAKQVITKEIFDDLNKKLEEFSELADVNNLFQHMHPKVTFKGKQELETRSLRLSDGYYIFLQDLSNGCSIFEITIRNNWALADTAKIFIRLLDQEFISVPDHATNKNVAIAQFIAGKLKTGEFLKRINKISVVQLEQAIRYQKELNDEGRHIRMASILIKLGFITDKGLDSLLLLKDEAKKRLPINVGYISTKLLTPQDEQSQLARMQRELSRLENENAIMKKRLKKILNITD